MSYTIHDLYIGQTACHSKTITETDVYLFAGITGDFNPAHVDAEYAKSTVFQERIAHGMLSASLISTVFGTALPGKGTIYLRQSLRFTAPVHLGDTITATVEIIELNAERNRAIFRTWCTNQNGQIVLDGEATVLPPADKK